MLDHQREFLQLALHHHVLRFGEFVLKSGRVSPYFFNAGLFNDGAAISALGRAYATTLTASGLGFDMLFGPAYKGIALATTVAIALADHHHRNVPLAFNRKEAKSHGEGGAIIGAPLAGRVLIVDDVITAGTAVREAIELIRAQGAEPAGVLIALDRQERGQGERSAVDEVRAEFGLPVVAIAGLTELLQFTEGNSELIQHRAALLDYRNRYGVAA
ncbi:MAG: orotate phosphoribosyltransferase [Xanthomonadales bacterium]|jgi:orotate phosphoribosyltransferase|nr:orotate phosphoribosyltransferase [Xanthomonadales bacterium]